LPIVWAEDENLRIYGLKACDTCRAAVKTLAAAGRDPVLVDLRATPPAPADLARFEAAFGEALVNRRSATWRGLSETERALPSAMLIAAHPAVMKRPLIEDDAGALHLGWTPEVRAALGL
jgi:arsenate reductase-like glutaredoxin family protein